MCTALYKTKPDIWKYRTVEGRVCFILEVSLQLNCVIIAGNCDAITIKTTVVTGKRKHLSEVIALPRSKYNFAFFTHTLIYIYKIVSVFTKCKQCLIARTG